jgi:hypothetical protein
MRPRIAPWLAATVTCAAVLGVIGAPLTTGAAPLGILSLELAGTPARAAAILASWDGAARAAAAWVQVLDTLFPVAYVQLGRALTARFTGSAGRWSAALITAGVLDALVENVALDVILWTETPSWPLVVVATAAAGVKLALLVAAIGAVVGGAISGRAAS